MPTESPNPFGINALDHGCVGDGFTDNSDAVEAMLAGHSFRKFYFPSGTYLVSRTIKMRAMQKFIGEGPCSHTSVDGLLSAPDFGTTFLPSEKFDGDSVIQIGTSNDYCAYAVLQDLAVLPFWRVENGVKVFNAGENCTLRNVGINRCNKSGVLLQGLHASFTADHVNCGQNGEYGLNCEAAPGSEWGNGGLVKLIGWSGDDDGIAQIRVTAHHELAIFGLKSEGQKAGVFIDTFDDSPRISFTGSLTFDSAHTDATLIRFAPTSFPHHAVVTTDACHNSAQWWIRDERPGGLMLRNDFGVVGRLQYGGANASYPTQTRS